MKKIIIALLFIHTASSAQTLNDARRLNDNEQYESASGIYKQLITKEPTNGTVYYYWGDNLLDAGDPDGAVATFTTGLQSDPSNQINNIGLAKVELYKGNLAPAKVIIDQMILQSKSKNALLLTEAGKAYTNFKAKDLLSAQTYLETAIKLDPKNPDIYNALGDVYSELNNGTEAAKNYNKALDLEKNYTKALLHKGQLYKRSTNYEGAAVEFQNALTIDQNFAPAYRELGEVYYLQRKLEKAKENYKKYLDLSKNNNSARLRYASFLFQSKNCSEGLAELNMVPYDSTSLSIVRLTAYLNSDCGDSIVAYNSISRVFSITEKDTTKRINRDFEYYGKILFKNGNDSLAGVYMWKSYYLDPSKLEMLDEMAKMFTKNKKHSEAAKAYEEKLKTGKATTTDYFNLGKAYYYSNDSIKADSAFTKVIELQPAYPYGYFWRGRTNLRMDPNATKGLANPYFEKFIELTATDTAAMTKVRKNELVEAYGNIALSYYNQKNYEKASEYCKKLLEIDAENQNAKKILGNIKLIRDAANPKKEN